MQTSDSIQPTSYIPWSISNTYRHERHLPFPNNTINYTMHYSTKSCLTLFQGSRGLGISRRILKSCILVQSSQHMLITPRAWAMRGRPRIRTTSMIIALNFHSPFDIREQIIAAWQKIPHKFMSEPLLSVIVPLRLLFIIFSIIVLYPSSSYFIRPLGWAKLLAYGISRTREPPMRFELVFESCDKLWKPAER